MRIPETAAELARALGELGGAAEHEVRLDIEGCRVDVATDAPELAAGLQRYFHGWLLDPGMADVSAPDFRIVALETPTVTLQGPWTIKQPEPGKTKIKEEWIDLPDGRVVRKRTTGMVFVFGGSRHLAVGPCTGNDNQVVNFINNRYMQWRLAQGFLLAHAGAVGSKGRCLALCGPSGAGKSTVALGLLTEGLDFVSNDRLLLRPDAGEGVEVHGIPKHPRVNPGTILFNDMLTGMIDEAERTRLLKLPPAELRVLEQKYDVLIDEHVGHGRFRMHGTLGALVVLNWTGKGPPTAREIDLRRRPELLPLITKSPGLFYEPETGQSVDLTSERYLTTLERTPVVEISGAQRFDEARRLCREILTSGAAIA